jgi:hypothetical protein
MFAPLNTFKCSNGNGLKGKYFSQDYTVSACSLFGYRFCIIKLLNVINPLRNLCFSLSLRLDKF